MVHSPFCNWQLPGLSIKSHWIKMLQSKLSKNKKSLTLSGEKMQQLIEDYWKANQSNRHKAFPQFWKNVNHILKRYNCNCNGRHSCELRNCWTTPPSLIDRKSTRLNSSHGYI